MHFNDRSKTAIKVVVNVTYSSPVEQDGSVRTVSKNILLPGTISCYYLVTLQSYGISHDQAIV